MSKVKSCSTKAKRFCPNIEKFASDQYGSGKRIFVGQSMNFNRGTEGVRVWYQYGSKSKEFVIMLSCPWCGGSLGWNKPKRKRPASRKGGDE